MTIGIDQEGLFAVYADWIAFLREKRTTFEGQLAKLQRKDLPGKDSSLNPKEPGTEAIALPVTPQIPISSRKEKKTKTPTPAPILTGTSLLEDVPPLPESENESPPDEKAEEIPEWLWQAERVQLERVQLEPEETPSPDPLVEDEEMDDWM